MGSSLSILPAVRPSDIFFPKLPATIRLPVAESEPTKTTSLRKLVEQYCPALFRPFVPPWWLFNGHLQTLYCVVGDFSKVDELVYHRKYLRLKDGGTIGLDFAPAKIESLEDSTPVIVVMHGLTGGSYEAYVRAILHQACKPVSSGGLGYRAVVMNFRGCAGVPLTTPQFYSAGWTEDIRQALVYLRNMYPNAPFLGLGFSLGANVLIRYLAQEKELSRLAAGCALACPWDLTSNCESMQSTFLGRQVYSQGMASNLIRVLKRNLAIFSSYPDHFISQAVGKTLSLKKPLLKDFDESFTRIAGGGPPVWPLASAGDYYAFASSHHVLPTISVPLLALNSADDPVVQKVPVELSQENPWTVIGVTPGGGHLGWFKEGGGRWMTEPVLEWMRMIVEKTPIDTSIGARIYTAPDGFLMQEGRDDLGCKEIEDAGFVQADKGDLLQGL